MDNGQTSCGTMRTWQCNGSGGGSTDPCSQANPACPLPPGAAACSAPKVATAVDGVCRTHAGVYGGQPASDNGSGCTAGIYSDTPDSATQFQWNCLGTGGGGNVSCSATIVINGSCAPFGADYVSQPATAGTGCASGNYVEVADDDQDTVFPGYFKWRCDSPNGGSNADCQATIRQCSGWEEEELVYDGWVGSGPVWCNNFAGGRCQTAGTGGHRASSNGGINRCCTSSSTLGWVRGCPGGPPPPSTGCTTPWGTTLLDGQMITAYQASSVPCGDSCVSETRTCTNGVLSGSFTEQTCATTTCPPPPCAAGTVTWSELNSSGVTYTCAGGIGTAVVGGSETVRDPTHNASAGEGQGFGNFTCGTDSVWHYAGGTCLGGQTCEPPTQTCP